MSRDLADIIQLHAALESYGVDQGWQPSDVHPAIAALTLESGVGGKMYSDSDE